MMESRKAVPAFRTITDFEWDVAPLPVHRQPATILHSDAYCMTAGERAPGRGVALPGVRARPRGPSDRRRDGTHRAVVARGGRVRRVPRPRACRRRARRCSSTTSRHIQAVPHIETWPEIEDVVNDAARGGVLRAGRPRGSGRAGGRDPRPDEAAVRTGERGRLSRGDARRPGAARPLAHGRAVPGRRGGARRRPRDRDARDVDVRVGPAAACAVPRARQLPRALRRRRLPGVAAELAHSTSRSRCRCASRSRSASRC